MMQQMQAKNPSMNSVATTGPAVTRKRKKRRGVPDHQATPATKVDTKAKAAGKDEKDEEEAEDEKPAATKSATKATTPAKGPATSK